MTVEEFKGELVDAWALDWKFTTVHPHSNHPGAVAVIAQVGGAAAEGQTGISVHFVKYSGTGAAQISVSMHVERGIEVYSRCGDTCMWTAIDHARTFLVKLERIVLMAEE